MHCLIQHFDPFITFGSVKIIKIQVHAVARNVLRDGVVAVRWPDIFCDEVIDGLAGE